MYVAPYAFAGANGFYRRRDQGLFLGYFKAETGEPLMI